jgi:class 3 adenylate cyclase/HAMP domain-containing protein
MSIRLKIVLVVVPLLLATLLLTGISSFFSATTGITRIAKDFLGFKAQELQKQAESQWRLLVENNLAERAEMLAAAQSAMEGYARSMVRSPTELILAAGVDGAVAMSTAEVAYTGAEQAAVAALARAKSADLVTIPIGGKDRVGKGFWFAPFKWYLIVTEERAAFYNQVNEITWRTGIILVIAIAGAVVLILVLAGYLTRPITRVVGTMEKIITTNDLSERVVVEYHDEIGQLAQTFNLMVGELEKAYGQIKSYAFKSVTAQKHEEKLRDVFRSYVPEDVINSLFKNPEEMLVGKNEVLAVLFCDIGNFSLITESMNPHDLVSLLNGYFKVMVDVIDARQGIVDKYIEHAIMALFGAPVKRDEDAVNSVLAGIEMIEALKAFNEGQKAAGEPAFTIGVGINYGVVTVGNIGTDKKMDYTVIGDMVNLASRLQGLTRTYHQQLIISESLHYKVKDLLPCRLIDSVAVKGREKGVKIYTAKRALEPREKDAWGNHNAAMEEYYRRNFVRAVGLFEEVLGILPGDEAATLLMKRSALYAKKPPPADWDGVEVMKTK